MTEAALQDIFVVPGITHFARKSPHGTGSVDALEPTGMLALVVILQVGKHFIKQCAPLVRKQVRWCVSVDNLVHALYVTINVKCLTNTGLPFQTADKTKFSATATSSKRSAEVLDTAT
jgi:hypothetical protein